MTSFLGQFKAARRASVPLLGVITPDAGPTVRNLLAAVAEERVAPPVFCWDLARAMVPLNEAAKRTAATASWGGDNLQKATASPTEVLRVAAQLPAGSVLMMLFANRYLDAFPVVQSVWNLRDDYKLNKRTLVLLGPDLKLPDELTNDVVLLEEELPTASALEDLTRTLYQSARAQIPSLPEMTPEVLTRAVDAVIGLPSLWAAEQALAMSMRKAGLHMKDLWSRKRQMVSGIDGLTVWDDGVTFADVGGLANVKKFFGRLRNGKRAPRVYVFIDEIEKAIGTGQDTSGVSQALLGMLLSWMQNKRAGGIIAVGPPGTSKSMVAQAAGAEAGVPTLALDLSALKGGIVGSSETNLRRALKTVDALAQGRAFFVATCNSLTALPPELRRRFRYGTFFFDLPDTEEREVIWKLWSGKCGIELDRAYLPDDTGWTGAEIATCCEMARDMGITLREAAEDIVPVSVSARETVEELRRQAHGRFTSASYPGKYQYPGAPGMNLSDAGRVMELED